MRRAFIFQDNVRVSIIATPTTPYQALSLASRDVVSTGNRHPSTVLYPCRSAISTISVENIPDPGRNHLGGAGTSVWDKGEAVDVMILEGVGMLMLSEEVKDEIGVDNGGMFDGEVGSGNVLDVDEGGG